MRKTPDISKLIRSLSRLVLTIFILLTIGVNYSKARGCTDVNFSYKISKIDYCTNEVCVDLSGVASGLHGTERWVWDFGDGTTEVMENMGVGDVAVELSRCHTYSAVGCYTVNLVVTPAHSVCDISKEICMEELNFSWDASCPGESDGCVAYEPFGSDPNITYKWSTGQTGQQVCGLPAGDYQVTITDGNGCPKVDNVTIEDPSPVEIALENLDCDNGSVEIGVTGGTQINTSPTPFSENFETVENGATRARDRIWSSRNENGNAFSFWEVSDGFWFARDIRGEAVWETECLDIANCGDIQLSLDVAKQCTKDDSYFRILYSLDNGPEVLLVEGNNNNLSDFTNTTNLRGNIPGGKCVKIVIRARTPTGGKPSCTIVSSSGGNSSTSTTTTTTTTTTSGGNNDVNPAKYWFDNVSLTCTPRSNNKYFYKWCNGSTTEDINNLPQNTSECTVTVTDVNGCSSTQTVTCCELDVDTLHVDAGCPGDCSGSIAVTPTTGTAPYSFTWSNNAGNTGMVSALCAGQYQVTVEEAGGCKKVFDFIIEEQDEVQITPTTVSPRCGECNGEIILDASGTAPFTYNWAHGATERILTGLCAGNYDATVTDNNGCTGTQTLSIGNSESPVLTFTKYDTECGACDGGASLVVSKGTPPYRFIWNDPALSGQNISSLCPGVYLATVTDSLGCQDMTTFTINNSGAPEIEVSGYTMNCSENCSGLAMVMLTTLTQGPYTYIWDDPARQTDSVATGLCVGTYHVTVSDNAGCQVFGSAIVDQQEGVTISTRKQDVLCFGDTDGWVRVEPTGGSPPYFYNWNVPATDSFINNLGSGKYSVTVNDENGCSDTGSVTIMEPAELTIEADSGVTCQGTCLGSAGVTISGGTQPYNILWSNGAMNTPVNELCAGMYTVTVTDANGCTAIETAFIDSIEAPEPQVWKFEECPGASVNLPAAKGGISYKWSPATNLSHTKIENPVAKVQDNIIYTVTVALPNGCYVVDTVHIRSITESSYKLHVPNAFSPDNDGFNDHFKFTIFKPDEILEYKMQIWNRWGEKIYETEDITQPWNGRYNGKADLVKDGAYVYIIKIKDNCAATAKKWDTRIGWVIVIKG